MAGKSLILQRKGSFLLQEVMGRVFTAMSRSDLTCLVADDFV